MRLSLAAALWLLPAAEAGAKHGASSSPLSANSSLVRRIAARNLASGRAPSPDEPTAANTDDGRRRLPGHSHPNFLSGHRRFHTLSSEANRDLPDAITPSKNRQAAASQENCDAAFLNCMPHTKCLTCFATMQEDDVDWASVKPETPCADVLGFLHNNGKCRDLDSDQTEKDVFCNTFNNCVVWDDEWGDDDAVEYGEDGEATEPSMAVDCDALTECDWAGMHKGFVGDGICHDAVPGCYNHAICKFDGGDCCQSTCKLESNFADCGLEGYACRDPESDDCDVLLTTQCKEVEPAPDKDLPGVDCASNETPYRLVQYDSWGDGWDAKMTIKDNANIEVYTGGLKDGAEGTEFVCLSTEPTCYHVTVAGGIWGNEISWEVHPLQVGAPAIADGGAPQECTFPIGGDSCEKTCDGRPDKRVQNDPDYMGYEQLLECLKGKCLIQIGACNMDASCKPCMLEDPPGYCFANDNYNALIDCALCHCTDDEEHNPFCSEKMAPGAPTGKAAEKEDAKDKTGISKACNADQTLKGSAAVMKFAQCSSVDSVAAMITEYDENNFGALDIFERCAHSYANDKMHGGKTAMDCMRVLYNTMKNPSGESEEGNGAGDDPGQPDAPKDAIAALSKNLYENAESFCDCAKDAAKECPLCESFLHFKTLLYETLDACKALDEIDCDAWNEFYPSCKTNLVNRFDRVDFGNRNQCEFVQGSCGDTSLGVLPSFRKLDCGREIPKPAWDFYISYDRGCLGGSADSGPVPIPTTPPPKPKPEQPRPPSPHGEDVPKQVTPPVPVPRPYVPPPDDEDTTTPASKYTPAESKPKKKRHIFAWFMVLCVAGGAYWYHKRRSGAFDFVRYRRARNWGTGSGMMGGGAVGGESEMYSGLNVDMSASSFEPPTLPPTPSAYGDNI